MPEGMKVATKHTVGVPPEEQSWKHRMDGGGFQEEAVAVAIKVGELLRDARLQGSRPGIDSF
ncbi:hypothetical protein BMS3Bbin02_00047 [bacterium BMS3Bbin02]|nr:hypothetical protein BMS3Bbin02_00047 [bacterium BMS3Bbin02]